MNEFTQAQRELIAVGQFLYQKGWSPATSSNYSMRLTDDRIAITVSGRDKGALMPDDIMQVDLDGRPYQTERRSSAETLLHTYLYRRFADVGVVLHTHSVVATILGLRCPGPLLKFRGYEMQKAFPGIHSHEQELVIPVFDNTQDIAALAQHVDAYLDQAPGTPAYVIRGHGIYTWGRDMFAARRHIEAMEFLLACEWEMQKS